MTESDSRHRLAAILAADVVGYSRLMALDESGTVAALDTARGTFRTHVESGHGRVVDMAGDSVLAVFDSATGAVSAALAAQTALEAAALAVPEERRMRYRIGVHLGDVIEKSDGTVYGDGVNLAARLESLAAPGGIAVSDAVQGAIRNRLSLTFLDRGESDVKNMGSLRWYAVRAGVPAGSPGAEATPSAPTRRDRPSVAVLPFSNMSGDPEQEYFADGISEDIITGEQVGPRPAPLIPCWRTRWWCRRLPWARVLATCGRPRMTEPAAPPGRSCRPAPCRSAMKAQRERNAEFPGNRLRPLHIPGHLRTREQSVPSWKLAAAASRSPRALERGGAFPWASVSG